MDKVWSENNKSCGDAMVVDTNGNLSFQTEKGRNGKNTVPSQDLGMLEVKGAGMDFVCRPTHLQSFLLEKNENSRIS